MSDLADRVATLAMRPQERAADYRVVAAWSAFLIFIGAGAFVIGMAIHN